MRGFFNRSLDTETISNTRERERGREEEDRPVHGGVEDVNGSIIGGGGHEGILVMVLHIADSLLVIFEGLVRGAREIEIKPNHTTIIAPNDDMIARWMDIK
jgi:hypothetical protein